jgi:hypothetical protein
MKAGCWDEWWLYTESLRIDAERTSTMSAYELESLVKMLRTGGPDLAAPPPQARENFEAMLAGIPIPDDVKFE